MSIANRCPISARNNRRFGDQSEDATRTSLKHDRRLKTDFFEIETHLDRGTIRDPRFIASKNFGFSRPILDNYLARLQKPPGKKEPFYPFLPPLSAHNLPSDTPSNRSRSHHALIRIYDKTGKRPNENFTRK
jgi:hypothetical protein